MNSFTPLVVSTFGGVVATSTFWQLASLIGAIMTNLLALSWFGSGNPSVFLHQDDLLYVCTEHRLMAVAAL